MHERGRDYSTDSHYTFVNELGIVFHSRKMLTFKNIFRLEKTTHKIVCQLILLLHILLLGLLDLRLLLLEHIQLSDHIIKPLDQLAEHLDL